MTQAETVHEAALHMRDFARETEIPGYAQMFARAADELDKRGAELELRHSNVALVVAGKID